MGKTQEIFDLHFLAKPGFFQANNCDVTKVEMPNCVLTCNMRNEFVAVRYIMLLKIQRLQMSLLLISASCQNKQYVSIQGCCLQNSLIFMRFAKNISREFVCLHKHHSPVCLLCKLISHVLNMNIHYPSRNSISIFCKWRLTSMSGFPTSCPRN